MPGASTFADEILEDGFGTEVAFQDESYDGSAEIVVEQDDGFTEQQEEAVDMADFSADDVYSADGIYPDELSEGEIHFAGEDISYYSEEDVASSDALNEALFLNEEGFVNEEIHHVKKHT